MKKNIFLPLLLVAIAASAQIHFEKGYFIDNQDVRTDCLIKNIDWNGTPTEFQYKLSEGGNILTIKDFEVAELRVGDAKYIGLQIAVDQSSDRLSELSNNKDPNFETSRILMKVLVDGTAKLYHFGKNHMQRFFYSVNGGPIEQLVYKRYYTDQLQTTVSANNYFRQQLWNNVKCEDASESSVEKLGYNKRDLTKYFESVNVCRGDKPSGQKATASKGSFNLKASIMLGRHSFRLDGSTIVNHDFGSKSYITFGVEGEYIFPFWNNKWSAIVEPSFNSYENTAHDDGFDLSVTYKYISLSAGGRHYIFINNNSKILLNVVLNYGQVSKSSTITKHDGIHSDDPYEFRSSVLGIAFGAGYNYQKFTGELRYFLNPNPSPYNTIAYKYGNIQLAVRYQFL